MAVDSKCLCFWRWGIDKSNVTNLERDLQFFGAFGTGGNAFNSSSKQAAPKVEQTGVTFTDRPVRKLFNRVSWTRKTQQCQPSLHRA
jgi:hypothetical protein